MDPHVSFEITFSDESALAQLTAKKSLEQALKLETSISMNNMDFRQSGWGSNEIFESNDDGHRTVDSQKDLEDKELLAPRILARSGQAIQHMLASLDEVAASLARNMG